MIPIPPAIAAALTKYGIYAAIAGACWLHGCQHGERLQEAETNRVEAAFTKFQDDTRTIGIAAQQAADARIAADKLNKEQIDADHKKTVADLATRIAGLRRANPGSSITPAAPADSKRPDLACFDRAEYQRTTGILVEGLRRLADEGTASTVDLDSAKVWALRMNREMR